MDSKTVGGTTYTMGYDSENRMTTITGGSLTARYVFDGDGSRVLSVVGDTRTLYVNEFFEITMENGAKVNQDLTIEDVDICENRYCSFMPLAISDIEAIGMPIGNFGTRTFITEIMEPDNANVTWRVYYPGGGLRVQTDSTSNLSYLVQDHLNSTAMTLSNSGAVTGEVIYSAWGETRATYGTTPTKKLYTSQYEAEAGLYFYNARWFDSELGRFAQADTIVPDSLDPQSWNRYTYVNNNPILYTDSSGHWVVETNNPEEEQRRNAYIYLAQKPDSLNGYLQEYYAVAAGYYYAKATESATENIEALVGILQNKANQAAVNGWNGCNTALDTAFRMSGVDVSQAMMGSGVGIYGTLKATNGLGLFDLLPDGVSFSTDEVLTLGQNFLGENPITLAEGVYVSSAPVGTINGREVYAQFRITDRDIAGHGLSPHANVELVYKNVLPSGKSSYTIASPDLNRHLYFSDIP